MAKFKVGDEVVEAKHGTVCNIVYVIENCDENGTEDQKYKVVKKNDRGAAFVIFEHELVNQFDSAEKQNTIIYHNSILLEAEQIVNGPRNKNYGHPLDDFTKTAALWSVIANVQLSPTQVALMMIALKISRQLHRPKRDNLVDMAGYAETAQMVVDEIDRRSDLGQSFGTVDKE